MGMSVEAEAIWTRILIQLEKMQREIKSGKQHTPGTGKNA